jgi:carbonic anhydrase
MASSEPIVYSGAGVTVHKAYHESVHPSPAIVFAIEHWGEEPRTLTITESLPDGYFSAVEDGQEPAAVSICCSDSRVSQEGMWDVDTPGTLFTVANIGNRATATADGERALDGGVAYPVTPTGTDGIAVAGHTGCGAVTAAYEIVRGETSRDDLPPGVRADVEPLVEVVENAPIDLDDERAAVVDRLVEHNVRDQVAFVSTQTDASVFGFVYDFHGRYGGEDGRTDLVATGDGERVDVVSPDYRGAGRSVL